MNASLSVFVPVLNGQSAVGRTVSQALEVLSEITPHFDLLIIDDGSTDATSEVAHELSLIYPQVRLLAHPVPWGDTAVMRSGLAHSDGEIVLFVPARSVFDSSSLSRLWRGMRTHDLAYIQYRSVPSGNLGGQPLTSAFFQEQEIGLQMVHRAILELWRKEAGDDEHWLSHFLANHYRFRCLGIEQDQPRAFAAEHRIVHSAIGGAHGDRLHPNAATAKRPNYVASLRAFALGE